MSAFAVIYERSNTLGDTSVFNKIMERLSHRGPDGSHTLFVNNISLGHWHFWTTPEEVGEQQPLQLKDLPFSLVLDGRLDNREELFSKLSIQQVEGHALSDAALILHAYAYWGEACIEHFIGEYAFVIHDNKRNELFCARDTTGDRTLFYSVSGQRVVIASEPWAVAAANGAVIELDERALTHYFSLKVNENGQTLFKNIYELLPAYTLTVNQNHHITRRYWQPDPSTMLRGRSDEEYAERFLYLLRESVRCRLRSIKPAGVLMSGGLDSTAIAALAARMLAPKKLTTISYVFDELKECDEREYINAVKDHWDIRSLQIPSDDDWPYKDWKNRTRNPNHPEINIYRLQMEKVYNQAREVDLPVLLTGTYGDHLYTAAFDWVADLILDGRIGEAVKELIFQVIHKGIRNTYSTNHPRRLIRRSLDSTRPGMVRPSRIRNLPGWMDLTHADLLEEIIPDINPVFERHGYLLNMGPSGGVSREIRYASLHHVELRHPYRDRRIVEFVLALPAYQMYRHGVYKYILRNAIQGLLPESVRVRPKGTSFLPFYFRGVENEQKVLEDCFHDKSAKWRKFVKPDWLLKQIDAVRTPDKDGSEMIVPWLCASFESWYDSSVLSC